MVEALSAFSFEICKNNKHELENNTDEIVTVIKDTRNIYRNGDRVNCLFTAVVLSKFCMHIHKFMKMCVIVCICMTGINLQLYQLQIL